MKTLREYLLDLVLLGVVSVAAGGAIMVLHGLTMFRRLRSGQSISECVTAGAGKLLAAGGFFTWLLVTEASTVPWDMIGQVALLVFTAPAILAWLGPPDQHVEACNLCQIGKGSAYSHFYGYLRLMQGTYAIRSRLKTFQRDNPAGLSEDDELRHFYSDALVVLAPVDGEYRDCFTQLEGINEEKCKLPSFQCLVGGNKRSYGAYGVYEVTLSGNQQSKRYVALEEVGALGTLRKLQQHRPAGLSGSDCKKQMADMIDELEKIVASNSHLRGQMKVVKYQPGDHVGDAIMTAIMAHQAG